MRRSAEGIDAAPLEVAALITTISAAAAPSEHAALIPTISAAAAPLEVLHPWRSLRAVEGTIRGTAKVLLEIFLLFFNALQRIAGGEGGIRTLDTHFVHIRP